MTFFKKDNCLKLIALFVVLTFVGQQCLWTAPAISFSSNVLPATIDSPIQIPASIGLIDEVHVTPVQDKTIYLIQDPHTNDAGQMNVARMLIDLFRQQPDLKYIFLEAGQGDESFDLTSQANSVLLCQWCGRLNGR